MKNENFVKRERYINNIKKFINKPVIKVIVGMRRSGKSVILKLLVNDLLKNGINKKNILYINKESLEFDNIKNYKDLYQYVKNYFYGVKGQKYIFIDEVQDIEKWELAISSFFSESFGDIIITGSNAKLLSSELSSQLTGRIVEIPVYTLSFREFLEFRKDSDDIETEFKRYMKYGGLPAIHYLSLNDEVVFNYLNSVIDTVLYKDIIMRNRIRDVSILDKVIQYLFDNIGNITTAKKIADYFKSQRIKVSVDTILNYIKYIESALLIKRVCRYNIKGKKILEFYDKIFLNDIGLRNGLIGYREKDINGVIENIVYNELRLRGYSIKIGTIDNLEIDFIAEKQNEKKYIQVCYLLENKKVVEREFKSLLKINDNYEKLVISMDKFFTEDIDGIKHRYLIDFLMEK
ncbi:MAG: ATP-binding protein [Elusimicrobiales bacterium]|jgi:predicted AAA+ superfamily ATPase|nr:ATP-binding protein [Elusimicrobiales bacterium]